jgi:ribose transport system substrate-binding protein
MRALDTTGGAVTLLGVILVLSGCSQPDSQSKEEVEKDIYTVGMSQCNLNEPWRVQMDADVRGAAEKYPHLKVIFKDAQNDAVVQQTHVEDFVTAGVDLIIISPKETDPLTKPVARAHEAGIPVIVLDRAVRGRKFTCFIGADNVAIGRAAGEWLVEALKRKGIEKPKVVELKGLMTSEPGKDRHQGFREAIADSEIEVIADPDMEWLEGRARTEMESVLDRSPEIHAVYAHNDPGAHGAYLAAKAAGRQEEMLFVGIDALPHEGVNYVKQGILDATFEYPTCGKEAIELADKILTKKIVLGSHLFTKENVDQGGQPLD